MEKTAAFIVAVFFKFQIDFGKWKRYYKIINEMLK